MVGQENRPEQADVDRRRFLELAAKLGVAAPVVVLVLADPKYAAASGFTPPGGSSSESTSSQSTQTQSVISHEGRAGDGDHRR